ncbi:MAG: hypothetical protein WBC06_05910 [Chitinophagaceae bacterium]
MFSQPWKKYLPIIKILMKRSPNGDQTLEMNRTDFERAAGGRKAKLTFSVYLHKGRIQKTAATPPPVARELAAVLLDDQVTYQLVREQDYEFSMNSSFQLYIKNTTAPVQPVKEIEEVNKSPEA